MEKAKVLEMLNKMPNSFSIRKALDEVAQGKTYSFEESKQMASKWLK